MTRVLQQALKETPVNINLLKRMVNYQLFDIERGDIQTMKELEIYAENTRSLLLYLNLHLLRIDDTNAITAASHLGRCIGICDVIKKIPFYLAKSRGYMPHEVLLKVSNSLACLLDYKPIKSSFNNLLLLCSIMYTLIRSGIRGEKVLLLKSSSMLF